MGGISGEGSGRGAVLRSSPISIQVRRSAPAASIEGRATVALVAWNLGLGGMPRQTHGWARPPVIALLVLLKKKARCE
jgi:hypothetical protein